MKVRTTVLTCLIGVVVLSMCYEYSRAESKADGSSLKIGVVSVRKILENSEKQVKYMIGLTTTELCSHSYTTTPLKKKLSH